MDSIFNDESTFWFPFPCSTSEDVNFEINLSYYISMFLWIKDSSII